MAGGGTAFRRVDPLNASERRNVSGARPFDFDFRGGAQRPSTAFAMMLR